MSVYIVTEFPQANLNFDFQTESLTDYPAPPSVLNTQLTLDDLAPPSVLQPDINQVCEINVGQGSL